MSRSSLVRSPGHLFSFSTPFPSVLKKKKRPGDEAIVGWAARETIRVILCRADGTAPPPVSPYNIDTTDKKGSGTNSTLSISDGMELA